MLSSIRKNIALTLLAAPFAMNCGYAQSPTNAATDSKTLAARTSAYATNDLFVNQWIHVNADGTIRGSVVALMGQDSLTLSKVRVSLSQNGTVVAFDDTDIDGEFLIEKMSPGLYSLTAEGAGSLALFSLVVLDEIAGKHLPNTVDIRMMPSSNRVSEIIRGQSNQRHCQARLQSRIRYKPAESWLHRIKSCWMGTEYFMENLVAQPRLWI